MFPNLLAEIARAGITQKELAAKCGIAYPTWRGKMSGKYSAGFSFSEAARIKQELTAVQGRELPPMEILFATK